jgi:hypothetical protein
MKNKKRCAWTRDNPLMIRYHESQELLPHRRGEHNL